MAGAFTRRSSLVGAATLMLSGARPAQAQARPLTIFAAASLREAMEAAALAFAAAGHRRPVLSYAGSNQLARQIEQGAPADLVFTADEEWMDYLAARQLLRPHSRRSLLGNSLVLVGPAGTGRQIAINRTLNLAGLLGGGRLAMPDPSVPAGRYARAALENLGLFAAVRGQIAASENVRVALAYVARGEAPLGLVYRTDALAEPKVAILGTIPKESHPLISYPIAITASTQHGDAERFLAFLQDASARAIFEKHGFSILR